MGERAYKRISTEEGEQLPKIIVGVKVPPFNRRWSHRLNAGRKAHSALYFRVAGKLGRGGKFLPRWAYPADDGRRRRHAAPFCLSSPARVRPRERPWHRLGGAMGAMPPA